MFTKPPGFKFKPSNEELVNHYLNRKIYGCLLSESNEQDGVVIPDHFIIPDMYIYDYDPWELQELFKGRSLAQPDNGECYFFCPRRSKYGRGHEENRTTKSGFWKQRGEKQTIRTSIITAEKIGLTFYRGQQRNGIVTEYKMHQYRPISNNLCNISPEEMPYDLCYIFVKKSKQDQGDGTPLYNEGDSSTAIISTANNMKISFPQTQRDHQRDEIIESEETYSSQLPMYHGTNEICSTQHNFDVYGELAFPSTAYAYARSFDSHIPDDHQVDEIIESEETYSSQLPMYHGTNEICSTQHNSDVYRELAFLSAAYAFARSFNSQIPDDHQVDENIESEETYSSQLPMYHGTNEICSTQHNSDVYGELAFPSTAYAYARSFDSHIPDDHQVDEIIESEETYSSQLPMYHGTNEICSTQHNSDVYGELAFPSTAYAYARSFDSQIPDDHQVDQPMEFEEIYSKLPQLDDKFNMIYPSSTEI